MDLLAPTREAFRLLFTGDAALWQIIFLSLRVSFIALVIAAPPGIVLGYLLATQVFPGRRAMIIVTQAMLSFPTVVVGLLLYVLLSRRGPLGSLGLLFTPTSMILGQAVIAFPVLVAFTLSAVQGADPRAHETALALGAGAFAASVTTLMEVRFAVMAGVFNGFGRVIAEVGSALMLGGNIEGLTRNITTAIALQTSKGEFAQGIALGFVLITLALLVNVALAALQGRGGLRE